MSIAARPVSTRHGASQALNVALWTAQVLLFVASQEPIERFLCDQPPPHSRTFLHAYARTTLPSGTGQEVAYTP
jgi:hypothetical protein